MIVAADDAVVKASPAAVRYGIVTGADLAHAELRDLVRQVRRDGVIREHELELARGPLGRGLLTVRARVAPLSTGHLLVLVEDRTEAHRVEQVRRDFVANVSHELKTPVGGISLLAEAVLDAQRRPRGRAPLRQPHAGGVDAAGPAGAGDRRPRRGCRWPTRCTRPSSSTSTPCVAEAADRCRLVASRQGHRPCVVSGDPRRRRCTATATCS